MCGSLEFPPGPCLPLPEFDSVPPKIFMKPTSKIGCVSNPGLADPKAPERINEQSDTLYRMAFVD